MPKETYSVQTPETLVAMAAELERVASIYRGVASDWSEMRIETLPVKGESERERSLKGAAAFANNARAAMWDELMRRKKMGAPISKEAALAIARGETPPESVSESVSDSPKKRTKK